MHGLIVLLLVSLALGGCAARQTTNGAAVNGTEPDAGRWKTWVLASGSQIAVPPPPDDAATDRELTALRELASQRDEKATDAVRYWDTGDPAYRWNEIALEAAMRHENWDDGSRTTSNLNVAIYDAIVAAWHWKYTYDRPCPGERDASLQSLVAAPSTPSYPSEHAVAAGAAATVLSYLFPDEAALFEEKARDAARSRLVAGAAYQSDVDAGLELGRKVGALVVERAKTDNSDGEWRGSAPSDPKLWRGDDPDLPAMGTWKTWVIESGSALRPPPPPAFGEADVAEVRDFKATTQTTSAALTWASRPAMEIWHDVASRLVLEHELDDNAPRAARVYALLHTAFFDATVASWDAKYAYWGPRPDQLDPSLEPLAPTPNFPGYPSAHATQSAAAAAVLAWLFPLDADELNALAEEAAASRLWLGIHFRADNEVGLQLGRAIAERAIARHQSGSR